MGTAESLYDGLDSQQCTQRDNQAGFNAGCLDTQQGTRFECCSRTRCTADSRELCTEGGSATARSLFAKRRSDFFCVHTQESRCVSYWNHRARWQERPHASRVAQPGLSCVTGIETSSKRQT